MLNRDVVTSGEAMALLVAQTTGDLAHVEHSSRRMAGCETNVASASPPSACGSLRSPAWAMTRWASSASGSTALRAARERPVICLTQEPATAANPMTQIGLGSRAANTILLTGLRFSQAGGTEQLRIPPIGYRHATNQP